MSTRRWLIFILLISFLFGCIQTPRMRSGDSDENLSSSESVPTDASSASNADDDDDDAVATPSNCDEDPNQIGCPDYDRGMPELSHIVNPFDGTYQTKVSIPKNFTGIMYIAGLNVYSLKNRLVHVRFNFGQELEPVTIPAQVGRGSGITPETDSEVLILNITDQPFYDIVLKYQLYDYNDYDSDDDGDKDGIEQEEPTTDPTDGNLFCRGLDIEYDPTFTPTTSNPQCNQAGNICKYAYANLQDKGLYDTANSLYYFPSEAQIDLVGDGYANLTSEKAILKCLPDTDDLSTFNTALGLSLASFPSYGADTGIGLFMGPFYPTDKGDWQISGEALFTEVTSTDYGTGLFQKSYSNSTNPATGYRSFLFPRAGKMSLSSDIDYVGTSDSGNPFDDKSIQQLDSDGESNYMDGCNFRVTGINPFTSEGIGSCNVTATIEVVEIDPITQETEIIASSTSLKLQLISPSSDLADATGLEELLYTPIRSCESSRSCGGDECCFNGRCWSKDLVTQCREDATVSGLLGTGEYCVSDYQCASLCCDTSRSVCAVHVNTEDEQVLCGKSPGQQCVSKEYCAQESIPHCAIYKTDIDAQGNQLCDIRCFTVQTHGDCVNGYCVTPETPEVPDFDADTYDCSQAADYPTTGFESD